MHTAHNFAFNMSNFGYDFCQNFRKLHITQVLQLSKVVSHCRWRHWSENSRDKQRLQWQQNSQLRYNFFNFQNIQNIFITFLAQNSIEILNSPKILFRYFLVTLHKLSLEFTNHATFQRNLRPRNIGDHTKAWLI